MRAVTVLLASSSLWWTAHATYGGLNVPTTAVEKRAACNADNCARAATGTLQGLQQTRLASCSSFQACTVYPDTVTMTATETFTPAAVIETSVNVVIDSTVTTTTTTQDLLARAVSSASTVCPSNVPATASACSGVARYASACSCAGVTRSFTTMQTPTFTTTTTITLSASTTTTVTTTTTSTTSTAVITTTTQLFVPVPTFKVVIRASDVNARQYNETTLGMDNGYGELTASDATTIKFTINDDGYIVSAGSTNAPADRVGVAVTIRTATFIVWDTRQHYQDAHVSYPFTKCQQVRSVVQPGSNELNCQGSLGRDFAICDAAQWNSMGGAGARPDPYVVLFSSGASHAGCYPFNAIVVPA